MTYASRMPAVLESVSADGIRTESGFQWPDDSATDRLLGVYRALLSADAALERSRQRVAIETRVVKAMLELK
jgi:hypothetical protein